MIIVVFRSRVRPDNAERYYALVDKMAEIATNMPGFISYKSFYSEDGERVTIHEWETAEHLKAWREHPEHVQAQGLGRQDFYEEYSLQVAEEVRTSRYKRPGE